MKLTYDHLVFTSFVLSNCSRKTFADEILITAPEGTEAVGNGEQWIIVFNDEDESLNGDGCEENMEKLVEEKVDQFSSATAAKDKVKKKAKIKQKLTKTLKAVAVEDMDEDTAKEFTKLPQVAYVEQNFIMSIDTDITWGIDRIDQRNLPLDTQFAPTGTGVGVAAYVIDTGVEIDHEEFGGAGGRARWGINTSGDGNDSDCHGHGTHVAGTVGGMVYGVAKDVELVAVKVLACNGEGTTLGVIAGVEWVAQDAQDKGKPATANMSLGGSHSEALNNAVKGLHNSGVPTVVAAGNSNADACAHSPASEEVVITVGSTTNDDSRSSFSNYGSCVDIFAPGSGITAAWKGGTSAYKTISGTSMASPHVCGAAAILLENEVNPLKVAEELTSRATQGLVKDAKDNSPNLLLYAGAIGPTNAPTAAPPTPAPTPCMQSTVTITVVPDSYPTETGWSLTNDCTGEVLASREKYLVSGREETDEECVPNAQYTFTITDVWNDGMCCEYGSGMYKVIFDGEVKKEGGQFGTFESTQFGSCTAETSAPTVAPTSSSTLSPTSHPVTSAPTSNPTTSVPTSNPTSAPSSNPTSVPTSIPTSVPTSNPTSAPTSIPTLSLTDTPTSTPILSLTDAPTSTPTSSLTDVPTSSPISSLTDAPTSSPILSLTDAPTPILSVSVEPSVVPSMSPVAENWQVLFKDTFEDGKSDVFKSKKFEEDETAQHGQFVAFLGEKKGPKKNSISSRKQIFHDIYSDYRLNFSFKCDGEGFKVNLNCGTGNVYEFLKEFKKETGFAENGQWNNEVLHFSCMETNRLNIQFVGISGKTYFDFVTLSGKTLSLPDGEDKGDSLTDGNMEFPDENVIENPWDVIFEDTFEDGRSNVFKQKRFLENQNAQHGAWVSYIGGQSGQSKNRITTKKQKVQGYSDFKLEFSYKWKDESEDFKVKVNYGTGFELIKEFNKADNFNMNDQWIDELIEFSHLATENLNIQFDGTGSGTYFDYVNLLAKSGNLPEGRDNNSDESLINDIPIEPPSEIISEKVFFYEQFSDVDSTEFGDLSSNLVMDIAHSEGGSYSITMNAFKSEWIPNISSFSKFEVSFWLLREGLENHAGLRLEYKFAANFRLAREWNTVIDFEGNEKWVKGSFIIDMPKKKKDKLKLRFQGFGSENDIGIYIDDLKLIGIP